MIMEYSEVKNRIFQPFADFISEVENIHYRVIQDVGKTNIALYPYSSFSPMIKKFIKNHVSVNEAKMQLRNFFKPVDPDLKQDFSNSIIQQIDNILAGLERLSGEPDKAELVSFLHKLETYLNNIKADIQENILLITSKKPKITHPIRGIAMLLAYQNGKIDPVVWKSKKELMRFIEKKFDISQGKNVYDMKGYKLEKLEKDCPQEYEAGIELYRKLF